MKFTVAAASIIGAIALAAGTYGMPDEQQTPRTIVARAAEANPNPNPKLVIVTETVTVTGSVRSAASEDTAGAGAGASSSGDQAQETSLASAQEQGTSQTSSVPSSQDEQQQQQQTTEQTDQQQQESSQETTPEEQTPAAQETSQQGSEGNSSGPANGGDGGNDGSSSGESFSGDGTYFTPGLGSCGKTNSDSDLIVAINAPQYGENANPNNAPVCNKCILAKGPKGEVKVTVTDRCPVCKHGDLDLSPSAFEKIADFEQGRVPITWSFVSC
ncbi:hypothetical protein LPJ64_004417 [Coemansia asiatica]|uniref:RlpA-like protein double-psi beta-barrel domain-containing protein n=1 Tax=Coemansia asiatica TaxID=1052880 RepID=A0A9W7XG62_9FUNG|nr:hypothetical protein LPJ64_004417 [Coemansia asiatica]